MIRMTASFMCGDCEIQDNFTSDEKMLSDEKAKVFKITACCVIICVFRLSIIVILVVNCHARSASVLMLHAC